MTHQTLTAIAGIVAVPMLIGLMAGSPIHPQSLATGAPGPLAFEVVSIKPSKPSVARNVSSGGGCRGIDVQSSSLPLGHCSLRYVTLKYLINLAYNFRAAMAAHSFVEGRQLDQVIIGGPPWANPLDIEGPDRFDIEAKADDSAKATSAELFQMLQPLLMDRFKLQVHTETRETSGLVLVVAKNGSKLSEADGDDKGSSLGGGPIGGGSVNARNTNILQLANYLSRRLGRPVADRTGLTGSYNFKLTWIPDDSEVGPNGAPIRMADGASSGPSLINALEDQLGLRLETQRILIPVIVIDHAEKPTLN